jgi:hypothetical protein
MDLLFVAVTNSRNAFGTIVALQGVDAVRQVNLLQSTNDSGQERIMELC